MIVMALARLPHDKMYPSHGRRRISLAEHFYSRDRLAGIVAAFLTSGGIVGFLTYVSAWLHGSYGMGIARIGLLSWWHRILGAPRGYLFFSAEGVQMESDDLWSGS